MHIEYTNEEQEHKKLLERIKTLTEKDKSVWVWGGKPLYKIGHGHEFLNGFFVEYTTLDAIKVKQFVDGRWFCGAKEYKFNKETDEFTEIVIERKEPSKIDWDSFSFPCSIKVAAHTIADELKPVRPMNAPNKKEDENTTN